LEKGSFPIHAHGLKALEVLCKNQAYVIKPTGIPKPIWAQVTWSRHGGPLNAWKEALEGRA